MDGQVAGPHTYLLHFEAVLPSEEYVQRRNARQLRVAHHEKIHIRLGNLRLLLFALTLILGWFAFRSQSLSPW